jgi:hypothetical protein
MHKCICGHVEWKHYNKDVTWNFSSCRTWTGREHCNCQEFKLDNLKYLEELSNGRE